MMASAAGLEDTTKEGAALKEAREEECTRSLPTEDCVGSYALHQTEAVLAEKKATQRKEACQRNSRRKRRRKMS